MPLAETATATSIGPRSAVAGACTTRWTSRPSPTETTTKTRSGAHRVDPAVRVPAPLRGWNSRVVTTGMATSTRSTLRYCTMVTTRSSAPSSRASATMPEAPPAISAKAPVAGETSRCRARSRPAATLITRVPTVTSATEGQSEASLVSVDSCTRAPITAPTRPWPIRNKSGGTSSSTSPVSAWTMPPSRDPNSTGEGRPERARSTLASTVTARTRSHEPAVRGIPGIATTLGARLGTRRSGLPHWSWWRGVFLRNGAVTTVSGPEGRPRCRWSTSVGGRDLRTCSCGPQRCGRRRSPERNLRGRFTLGLVGHHHRDDVGPAVRRRDHRPPTARTVDEGAVARTGLLRRPGGPVRHRRLGTLRRPVRHRVLRGLADRVLAVGGQPLHLHHHHGQVRRALRVPAGGPADRD